MIDVNKLEEQGYNPYRRINKSNWNMEAKKQAQKIIDKYKEYLIFVEGDYDSDESIFYAPCYFNKTYHIANFNAMQVGGTDVRFIKDKDLNTEIIFGLEEYKKPPTIINYKTWHNKE